MVYPETKKIKINQNKLGGVEGGEKPINYQAGRPAAHLHFRGPQRPLPAEAGYRLGEGPGRASNQLCLHYESERWQRYAARWIYIYIINP